MERAGREVALAGARGTVQEDCKAGSAPLYLTVGSPEQAQLSYNLQRLLCVTLSRVCEYVGTLEHTHFSDGTSRPPLTISQPQKAPRGGLLGDPESEGSPQEQSLEQGSSLSAAPVIQPLSIQELVREGSRGRASDFRGGSLMTGSSAAKVVLTLSTQADRCALFPPRPGGLSPKEHPSSAGHTTCSSALKIIPRTARSVSQSLKPLVIFFKYVSVCHHAAHSQ